MATEICTSDWDLHLPLGELFGLSGRARRIRSDTSLMNRKLGADLLLEILIRLPDPKSACRCKLVCPLWRSVISDPSFNRRYVSHHQTMNPEDLKSMVLSFLPPMPRGVRDALKVLDCDRDLVLCGFWDLESDERNRSYLVCNPFTKQWSALPLAPKKLEAHGGLAARLVCEPQTSSVHSGYRFRVACIYQDAGRAGYLIKLDVFCSEYGEWIKEALVRDGLRRNGLISWNGELFWMYLDIPRSFDIQFVAVFNPFRLDMPPTSIDVSAFLAKPLWFIALSQDALHVIVLENEVLPHRSSIWRLEEDRKSWRKQCEGLVNKTSKCCNYEVKGFHQPSLHPQKPEIVFFNWLNSWEDNNVILCLDLTSGEVEFLAKQEAKHLSINILVFQPRVPSCRFTPIPNFDNMYNESFSFLSNSSSDPRTPSLTNEMRDATFAPAKSLLLTDSNSKVRRVTRRNKGV